MQIALNDIPKVTIKGIDAINKQAYG